MSPLVQRIFPKLPGRRPHTPKTVYIQVQPGLMDIYGTDPNQDVVINILLPRGVDHAATLKKAEYVIKQQGYELNGGWREPLRPDSGLIATAALRKLPRHKRPAEYQDPHP